MHACTFLVYENLLFIIVRHIYIFTKYMHNVFACAIIMINHKHVGITGQNKFKSTRENVALEIQKI